MAEQQITRGHRNNNIGNIRMNPANQWEGSAGNDGTFEVFNTPQDGIRALGKTLNTYQKRGVPRTIDGIINTWAPNSENDTSSYISAIANNMGIHPNQEIPEDRMPELMANIGHHENGGLGNLTENDFNQGWYAANLQADPMAAKRQQVENTAQQKKAKLDPNAQLNSAMDKIHQRTLASINEGQKQQQSIKFDVDPQADALFDDDSIPSSIGNSITAFTSAASKMVGGIVNTANELHGYLTTDNITAKDKKVFQGIDAKRSQVQELESQMVEGDDLRNSVLRNTIKKINNSFTPEEQAFIQQGKLENADNIIESAQRGEAVSEFFGGLDKYVNRRKQHAMMDDAGELADTTVANYKDVEEAYENGDYAKAAWEAVTGTAELIGDVANLAVSNPRGVALTITDSAPQIIGMSRALVGKALTTLAAGGRNSQENVATWLKEGTGDSDLNTARAFSLAQTAIELTGDRLLGMSGGRSIDTATKALKSARETKNVVTGTVGVTTKVASKLTGDAATEGVQEAAENLAQQAAVKQDASKIDAGEAVESAIVGAAVGGSMGVHGAAAAVNDSRRLDKAIKARDAATDFSAASPKATEIMATNEGKILDEAVKNGFAKNDLKNATDSTINKLYKSAMASLEIGDTSKEPVAKAIAAEMDRRDAVDVAAAEAGEDAPSFGSAESNLDVAINEKKAATDIASGKTKMDLDEFSKEQLEDLLVEADTIASSDSKDNKQAEKQAIAIRRKLDDIANKQNKTFKTQIESAKTAGTKVAGVADNIDAANSSEVISAAASIMSGHSTATPEQAQVVLNKQIANITPETHGSSSEAVIAAQKASRKVVAASQAVTSAIGEYNALGTENLSTYNDAHNAAIEANFQKINQAITNKDIPALENAMQQINAELSRKKQRLDAPKSDKFSNTGKFKTFLSAEQKQLEAVIDFVKRNVDLVPELKEANLDSKISPRAANINTAGTSKQSRITGSDASTVSLNKAGQVKAIRHLIKSGALSELVTDDNATGTLTSAVMNAGLTKEEAAFITQTKESGRFQPDPEGKLRRGILSKLDKAIQDDKAIPFNNLADYMQTNEPTVFKEAYKDRHLIDTREVKDSTEAQRDKDRGKVFVKLGDTEVDALTKSSKAEMFTIVRNLMGFINAHPKASEYQGNNIASNSQEEDLQMAIKQAASFINANKIPNKYSNRTAQPKSPTPKYKSNKSIFSKGWNAVTGMFNLGNGKLGNRVSGLLNLIGNPTATGSGTLHNGLNQEQMVVLGKVSKLAQEVSGKIFKGHVTALTKKELDDGKTSKQKLEGLVGTLEDSGVPKSLLLNLLYEKDEEGNLKFIGNQELFDIAALNSITYGLTEGAGSQQDGLTRGLAATWKVEPEDIQLPKEFGRSGVTKNYLVPIIGERIAATLGITADKDGIDSTSLQKIQTELGNMAMTAMRDAGLVKSEQWYVGYNKKDKTVTASKKKADGLTGYQMYSFNTDGMKGLKDAGVSTVTNWLSDLVDIQNNGSSVLVEPQERKVKIRSELSEVHEKAIVVGEGQSTEPNFELIDMFLRLSQEDQLTMMGLKDPKTMLPLLALKEQANIDVLEEIIDNLNIMNSNRDEYSSIYQRTLVGRNLRLTQHSGMSWQANKLVRAMLGGFKETYSLDSKTKSSMNKNKDTYTEEDALKVAFAKMFDEDKLGVKGVNQWFTRTFAHKTTNLAKKNRTAAIIAYQLSKGTPVSKPELELLQEVVKSGGLHAESLSGLVAVGAYFVVKLDPNNTKQEVTVDVFREDDGIANGIAISMAVFGIETNETDTLSDLFGRVGITLSGEKDLYARRDASKHPYAPKEKDMYQHFGEPVTQAFMATGTLNNDPNVVSKTGVYLLNEGDTTAENAISALKKALFPSDNLDKVMRNLVKEPLMRYIYGAGNQALQDNIRGQLTDSILADVQTAYEEYLAHPTAVSAQAFRDKMTTNNEALDTLARLSVDPVTKTISLKPKAKEKVIIEMDGSGNVTFKKEFTYTKKPKQVKNKQGKWVTPKTRGKEVTASRVLNTPAEVSAAIGQGIDYLIGDAVIGTIDEKFGATKQVANVFNTGVTMFSQMMANTYNLLVANAVDKNTGLLSVAAYAEIMETMDKTFKGIPSALSDAGKFNSALRPVKMEPVKGSTAFTVHSPNGTGHIRTTTDSVKDSIKASHVTGSPFAIHSLDASIIADMLIADPKALQVYDGIIQSGKTAIGTDASNDSFTDRVMGEYNPINAIEAAIIEASTLAKEALGGMPADMDIGEVLLDIDMKSHAYNDGDQIVKNVITVTDFIKNSKIIAAALAEYRSTLKELTLGVNQYGNSFGVTLKPDTLTPAARQKLIAKAEAAFKTASEASDLTTWKTKKEVVFDSVIAPPTETMPKKERTKARDKRAATDGLHGVNSTAFKTYHRQVMDHISGKFEGEANAIDHYDLLRAYSNNFLKYERESLTAEETAVIVKDLNSAIEVALHGAVAAMDNGEVASTDVLSQEQLEADRLDADIVKLNEQAQDGVKTEPAPDTGNNTAHGSTPLGELSFETQVQSAHADLQAQDAQQTFHDLLNNPNEVPMDAAHTGYLSDLIGKVGSLYSSLGHKVNLAISTRLDAGGNQGAVTVTGALSNIQLNLRNAGGNGSLSQSAQEVFAHEYVHPFWDFALTDRNISEGANILYNQVLASNPTYTLFLDPSNTSPSAADIATAKGHFKHVFHNRDDGLVEFLTMGITNEMFRENLADLIVEPTHSPVGFWAKLGHLWNKVLGLAASTNKTYETSGVKAKARIDELFVRGQSALNQAKSTGLAAKISAKTTKTFSAFDNLVDKHILKVLPLNAQLVEQLKANPNKAPLEVLSNSASNMIREIASNNTQNMNGHINEIFNQMFGDPRDLSKMSSLLAQGTTNVDAVSQSYKAGVMTELHKLFKRDLTETEHKAATNIIGRTDISALFNYGFDETDISAMLAQPQIVQHAIDHFKTELINTPLSSAHLNALDGLANAAGHFMIHENQAEGAYYQNPDMIVNVVGKAIGKIPSKDRASVVRAVDAITSLYALQKTSASDRATFATILNSDNTKEGVLGMMAMQRALHSEALEAQFKNTPYLMKKGFYSQVTNQNMNVTFAPIIHKARMKHEGYDLVAEKTIPAGVIGTSAMTMGVYKRTFGGKATKSNSALLSVQNHKFGESIEELIEITNQGLPVASIGVNNKANAKKHEKKMFDEIKVLASRGRLPTKSSNELVAVPSDDGQLKEFRLDTINTEFKEKHLKLSHDYIQSLATAGGRMVYKAKAPIHNDKVIDEMVAVFNRDYARRPQDFTVYALDDPRIADQYATLEPHAKKRLARSFGEGKLIVKRNQVNPIFGYRRFDVFDMKHNPTKELKAHNEILRLANNVITPFVANKYSAMGVHYTQEMVAELYKTIVVKTGAVTAANTVSNMRVTQMYGMDSVQTAKDVTIGFRVGAEFLKLRDQLGKYQADLDIELGKPNANKNKIGLLQARLGALETRIEKHPAREYDKEGLLSTVMIDHTADVSNQFSARGAIRDKANELVLNKAGVVGDAIKEAYALEDSHVYSAAQMATIMSDFAFKYAMHEHHMKNTEMTKEESFEKINYIFLAYETPSAKPVDFLESIGVVMFTKYKQRIQRVVISNYAETPARAIRTYEMQEALLGNTADIHDSSYFGQGSIGDNIQNPFSMVGMMLIPQPLWLLYKAVN